MTMRPIVGITSYAEDARWGVWEAPAALIPLAYVHAVEAAGGRALIVPPSAEAVEETLDALDGLLLSGGADVEPRPTGRRHTLKRTASTPSATAPSWRCSRPRSRATCPCWRCAGAARC